MKYLIALFISLPTFAARFADDIRSLDHNKNEVTVTFSTHTQVHRIPASSHVLPCLENGFKAKKPVDVVISDESGNIIECKLAPRMHPGAVGI